MNIDGAIVEVVEYDGRGVVLRVCVAEEPRRILNGLDLAEDLLDAPARLGDWAEGADGTWRGLAVRSSAL